MIFRLWGKSKRPKQGLDKSAREGEKGADKAGEVDNEVLQTHRRRCGRRKRRSGILYYRRTEHEGLAPKCVRWRCDGNGFVFEVLECQAW